MILSLLRHPPKRILLIGWLLALHLVLVLDAESPIGRSLLIVHFGLFLLWQPFVGSRLVVPWPYLLLLGILLAAVVGLGWWALIVWMMLLAGVVGGRIFFDAPVRVRLFYLLVMGDLIGVLLLVAVPTALSGGASTVSILYLVAEYGVPLLLCAMLFLPMWPEEGGLRSDTVDLVYSLFILLLLAVLVAGAIAVMHMRQLAYFEALLLILLAMATVILALALVWSPRFGFSGLAALLSRYMLADSLPFDRLLRDVAESARQEQEPGRFVQRVGERSQAYLAWVRGAQWSLHGSSGAWGESVGVPHRIDEGPLQVTLFTSHPMSPTLLWHSRLFVQLLEEYCQTMIQARQLRELAYVQAVHQTGARLTHDVKNLLQSLNTLCAACAEADVARSNELYALMQRQLPAISQRLQATLGKLAQPVAESGLMVSLRDWWAQLAVRYEGRAIIMQCAPEAAMRIVPGALFDSAAENLLQNALDKRGLEAGIMIRLEVLVRNARLVLAVEDSGSPVPAELMARLGLAMPNSENGLGLGLYQLRQQAETAGYTLQLVCNQPGCVRFELMTSGGERQPQ